MLFIFLSFLFKNSLGRTSVVYEEHRNFILDCVGKISTFYIASRGIGGLVRFHDDGLIACSAIQQRHRAKSPSPWKKRPLGHRWIIENTVRSNSVLHSATFFASTRFPRCGRHESRSIQIAAIGTAATTTSRTPIKLQNRAILPDECAFYLSVKRFSSRSKEISIPLVSFPIIDSSRKIQI